MSLVYGFTKASSDGWAAAQTLAFLGIAVVLLVAFVVVETRASHPLLPLRVVAERNRGGSFLASFLLGAGLFTMFVFLSYYMQTVLDYSALRAGVAFLPFAVGLILAATASFNVVPRIGPRIPMAGGLLVGAIGLAWLTQIGVDTSFWLYVFGPQILMSVGFGFAFPRSDTALTNFGPLIPVWQGAGQHDATDRRFPGNRSAQHGGRHGDAGYITAHGVRSVSAGLVHGYAIAFAVGAVFLVIAALAAAVFVTDKAANQPVVDVDPVLATE